MTGIKLSTLRSLALLALVTLALPHPLAQPAQSGGRRTFKGPWAIQLWSFRRDFQKDVRGTLQRVRALGFTDVELAGYYGLTATQFRAALDRAGLRAVSMHVEYQAARDRLDQVMREAKILGVEAVGVPWIKAPLSRAETLAAIQVFNQAGRRLAANGLKFFYHLHGYEFVPDEGGRGTLLDLLMAETDPRLVSLQLDTYHVAYPGRDPVKLLEQYPGRFSSLHLKDLRRGAVGDHSGAFREADQRPLGQGKIDWPGVLRAARQQGVRWYIIEDESSTPWQGVAESLKYLETVTF